jgi:pimeloyl-ACP methyl ester carboxylesterase
MPDFVMTSRAPHRDALGERFGDEPGSETVFLQVPDGREMAPSQAITKKSWVKKVLALCPLRDDASGVKRRDLLVFIHGYNNSPAITLQRHRRLKKDLAARGFEGGVVTYSWPAGESALAYLEDRHDAKITALRLVSDCLVLFAQMQQEEDCTINVHILAHSTGAYVVREAFDDADDHAIASINWTASQVVFIGGDVSSASLAAGNPESESLYRHCIRLTNYSSAYDEALQLSNAKRVGLGPRVGRVGLPGNAPNKAVNVDCSDYFQAMIRTRPASDIIGYPTHSWHIGDPTFMEDLVYTLKGDLDRYAIPSRTRTPDGGLKLGRPALVGALTEVMPPPPPDP